MLHSLDDTNSEIIHYRAQTNTDLLDTPHKGFYSFNPRLGFRNKRNPILGATPQQLKINPVTGGYDIHEYPRIMTTDTQIDLTKDLQTDTNINTNINENESKNIENEAVTTKVKKKKGKNKSKTKKTGRKRRQSSSNKNEEPPKKKNQSDYHRRS